MKKFTEWVGVIRQAELNEASELQKSYQDYFKRKLDKFGAKSPAELSEDDKKKFFNEITTEWEKGKGLKDGVKEGIDFNINESETADSLANFLNKEQKHFAAFLKPKNMSVSNSGGVVTIKPASGSFTITVDFNKSTIDSTGKPPHPESVSYVEIITYIKGRTKFKVLNESIDEAEIKSAEEFKKFAEDKLKKVHGDNYDEAKAAEVIKGLSDEAEKSGDWGAAVGKLNKA